MSIESVHGPVFESEHRLGLTEENCVAAGEPEHLIFTTEEVPNLNHSLLRRLAAAAEGDAVHGKSTTLELRDYFIGQLTLGDFERE